MTLVRLDDLAMGASPSARAKGVVGSTVKKYADAMRAGAPFPPIDVFKTAEGLLVADGLHRVAAADRNGAATIEAVLHVGTVDDALWFALHANVGHDAAGRQRTNADKRHAVTLALSVKAWRGKSTREIAEWCGVSNASVQRAKLLQSNTCPNPAETDANSAEECTPGCTSKRVEGRDGKFYPATKTKRARTKRAQLDAQVGPLVAAGESTTSIASKLGVDPHRVSESKRRLGLTKAGAKSKTPAESPRRVQVRRMVERGEAIAPILDALLAGRLTDNRALDIAKTPLAEQEITLRKTLLSVPERPLARRATSAHQDAIDQWEAACAMLERIAEGSQIAAFAIVVKAARKALEENRNEVTS